MKAEGFEAFSAGLGAGFVALGLELTVFVGSVITRVVNNAISSLPSTGTAPVLAPNLIPIFILLDLAQNFISGAISISFGIGFAISDLVILFFVGGALWTVMPLVTWGLVGALIADIVGMIIKIFLSSGPSGMGSRYIG